LLAVREVTAIVLVAEKQTILATNLTDLDHFLVLCKLTIVKGGPLNPFHLRHAPTTVEQLQTSVISPYAEWR
jgi:hypothetical protein